MRAVLRPHGDAGSRILPRVLRAGPWRSRSRHHDSHARPGSASARRGRRHRHRRHRRLVARRTSRRLLEVVAASGPRTVHVVGATVAADAGTAGFVLGPVRQWPSARTTTSASRTGVAAYRRAARNVLCIPCESDDGSPTCRRSDKVDGTMFNFDDVSSRHCLAGVAGVAIRRIGASPLAARPAPTSSAATCTGSQGPTRVATRARCRPARGADCRWLTTTFPRSAGIRSALRLPGASARRPHAGVGVRPARRAAECASP